jgi:hypothetical protein
VASLKNRLQARLTLAVQIGSKIFTVAYQRAGL